MLNYENSYTREIGSRCPARVVWFSSARELEEGYYLKGDKVFRALSGQRQELLDIHRDMRLVGPGPERPEFIEENVKSIPEFAYRTKVKAGLTGYAQVYGKYNTGFLDKLKLDLLYIQKQSVWLDLKIMVMTIKVVFTKESTEGLK